MTIPHLFNKDRVVGIDIGSAYIKVAELEPTGSGWQLARAAVCPTPPNSCHDGMVSEPAQVAQALRAALDDADINASGAIAAVSGSQVLVRHVQLPKMTEQTLQKSIRFEAAKYISANVEDNLVEYEVLGPGTDEDQMQIMLVAAPRDLVESRVEVIEKAGLEALVVDIEPFALMRSLVEFTNSSELMSETVGLVDMGAGHTDLNVISQGRFALTRNIPIAGSSLSQAIKSLAGCTDEEADALKHRIRVGPQAVDTAESPDENLLKAGRAVQPLLDELLREIRRSLHFYQSQFPEGTPHAQVTQLLLTGGASKMSGLPEYVSAKLGVRTSLVNVLEETMVSRGSLTSEDSSAQGPLFGVTVGLALKGQPQAALAQAA